MQTDVLISFIIPAYNAADTIEKAVQSLTDVPRTEVLIVENGSTDETKQVLERLKKKYSNIKIFTSDKGVSNARNLGIQNATGEWLAFVDADDYLTDNCVVSELIKKMENVDIVVGNYQRLWKNRLLDASKNSGFAGLNMNSVGFAFGGFFSIGTLSYAWAKLYRKSFLDSNKIEFGDYRYAEDKIYNYFCYIAGARYAFIDKKFRVYCWR